LPKAFLHHFGIRRGINLFVASEVPPDTGLGSSSASAVIMVRAISTSILKHQRKSTQDQDNTVLQALRNIKQVACEVQTCLEQGDLDEFARLLGYSWQEKRRLAPGLSTSFIDECYNLALQHGCKLLAPLNF